MHAAPDAAHANRKLLGTVAPNEATKVTAAATSRLARHTCKVIRLTSPKLLRNTEVPFDDVDDLTQCTGANGLSGGVETLVAVNVRNVYAGRAAKLAGLAIDEVDP